MSTSVRLGGREYRLRAPDLSIQITLGRLAAAGEPDEQRITALTFAVVGLLWGEPEIDFPHPADYPGLVPLGLAVIDRLHELAPAASPFDLWLAVNAMARPIFEAAVGRLAPPPEAAIEEAEDFSGAEGEGSSSASSSPHAGAEMPSLGST